MKHSDSLHDVLKAARSDLRLIRDLAREGDGFFETKANTPPAALSAAEAAELRSIGEIFQVPQKIGVKRTIRIESKNVADTVWHVTGSIKQRTFFSEMALV